MVDAPVAAHRADGGVRDPEAYVLRLAVEDPHPWGTVYDQGLHGAVVVEVERAR